MRISDTHLCWPVPDSFSRKLPRPGSPGSFRENRGDRLHCGVDIYAPHGSEVCAIGDGIVVEVGLFTSPEIIRYWNETYLVAIRMFDGLVCRYGELAGTSVRTGQAVRAGDVVGRVGTVLRRNHIDSAAPDYVRALKQNRHLSMLHFELLSDLIKMPESYLGGNLLSNGLPGQIKDPGALLAAAVSERPRRS